MNPREIAEMRLGLKAGEWVVVRPPEEILATLDAQARLEGMPFQPEMLAYCGKRYKVHKVAHKTCDTVNMTGGRSVPDAVHLEGVRCDGGAHAGCQARCLMFWKEAWLTRAGAPHRPVAATGPALCTESTVRTAAVAPGSDPGDPDPTWVCQTTALPAMSRPLPWWDARQYLRDVRTGNHTAWKVAKMLSFGTFRMLLRFRTAEGFLLRAYDGFQKLRGGRPYPRAQGSIPLDQPTPKGSLDLRPGEAVRIKSAEAIRATLNVHGRNRGMWFDQEMVKFCGQEHTVELRIERLIEEKTGKMLVLKNPCIQLRGVTCLGECTADRLGCPRAINAYWREIWLERMEGERKAPVPKVDKPSPFVFKPSGFDPITHFSILEAL
ncbi:MAG TPA: hypothetical protein VJ385_17600 [Fibrobacteria bacterium]|nr:hypothetical protein [Fibrobacteria bacterium]